MLVVIIWCYWSPSSIGIPLIIWFIHVKVITLLVDGLVLFGNFLPSVEPHAWALFHI
jgi:hypothetical protein